MHCILLTLIILNFRPLPDSTSGAYSESSLINGMSILQELLQVRRANAAAAAAAASFNR